MILSGFDAGDLKFSFESNPQDLEQMLTQFHHDYYIAD